MVVGATRLLELRLVPMTENEKAMYEALTAIARRDCAGYCGLIARKTIERIEQADIDSNKKEK